MIYDPPGSGLISLGLAIGTYIVVAMVAQAIGFAAGPGWLIWYWIVRSARKRDVRLKLDPQSVEEAVLDMPHSRLALKATIEGRDGWLGLQLSKPTTEVPAMLRDALGDKFREGRVKSADTAMLVVLAILAVLLLALLVSVALNG